MINRDVLVEVRTENLPAGYILSAEKQLEAGASARLAAAGLSFEGLKAYGTYRRLVLYINGLPSRTPEAAAHAGTPPAGRKMHGRPALKELSGILPALFGSLEFPGTVEWEEGGSRFARPVRGVTALYGDKTIPFSFAGVRSGRSTVGLGARGDKQLRIPSAEKYFRTLENANVLARDQERAEAMSCALAQAAKRMKLEVEADEDLLRENLYLAEYPVCVVGAFDQEFLKLPAELLDRAMRERCKFFSVRDSGKKRQPYFVAFRDGVSKCQKTVEDGFRCALEARLRDAAFSVRVPQNG